MCRHELDGRMGRQLISEGAPKPKRKRVDNSLLRLTAFDSHDEQKHESHLVAQ